MKGNGDLISFLAGVYTMHNESKTQNGADVYNLGWGAKTPVGLLTYTESGYMSAVIAATDTDLFPADLNVTYPVQEGQSDADWARAGRHTLAYAGPWTVTETAPGLPPTRESGRLVHGPLTAAHIPSWIGAEKERNYTMFLEGGDTYLRMMVEVPEDGIVSQIWWRKLV